jgi:hypothetical protein
MSSLSLEGHGPHVFFSHGGTRVLAHEHSRPCTTYSWVGTKARVLGPHWDHQQATKWMSLAYDTPWFILVRLGVAGLAS